MVASSDLIAYGKTAIGKPYVFGDEGPNSFDCSGLMQWIFKHFGISLPRTTGQQVGAGYSVPIGQYKPGDLVFSSWDGTPHSHVGMYIGNGQILVAPHSGTNVQIQTLNSTYQTHIDAVRRMPQVDDNASGATLGDILSNAQKGVSGAIGSATEGVTGLGSGAVEAISSIGKLGEWVMKLGLPTTMTRIVSGVASAAFIIIGIIFIGRGAM